MAYTDFNFYANEYKGSLIPSEGIESWLERASDELDTITYMRLENAFPIIESHVKRVKKAVCAVADALYQVYITKQASLPIIDTEGKVVKAVSSVSSGRESIKYVEDLKQNVYSAALTDESAYRNLIVNTASRYIANIPDANGINLLYSGAY